MHEKIPSYLITSFTPTDLNDKFITIKKRFGLYFDQPLLHQNSIITLNNAHITLKRRFYLKEEISDSTLLEHLTHVSFKPISITANRLEIFQSKELGNVLVALVDPNEGLANLHLSILRSLSPFITQPSEFEGLQFKPHLSLLYNIPSDKIDKAFEDANKNILPISYILSHFSVLKNIPGVDREREILKIIHTNDTL